MGRGRSGRYSATRWFPGRSVFTAAAASSLQILTLHTHHPFPPYCTVAARQCWGRPASISSRTAPSTPRATCCSGRTWGACPLPPGQVRRGVGGWWWGGGGGRRRSCASSSSNGSAPVAFLPSHPHCRPHPRPSPVFHAHAPPPPPAVAAIHAGAAIHCWPNPAAALAEVSRVLRPGGVFVASTFLNAVAPLGQALGSDALVRPLSQVGARGWLAGRGCQCEAGSACEHCSPHPPPTCLPALMCAAGAELQPGQRHVSVVGGGGAAGPVRRGGPAGLPAHAQQPLHSVQREQAACMTDGAACQRSPISIVEHS